MNARSLVIWYRPSRRATRYHAADSYTARTALGGARIPNPLYVADDAAVVARAGYGCCKSCMRSLHKAS